MKPNHSRNDPLERAIEMVLAPGSFISYRAASSFVEDVQTFADKIDTLVDNEPERAVRLYEVFISACHEKADEVDDSSGSFGALVEGLFCGWIRACQATGANRDELAKSLLAWIDDDPYGYCFHLDREAVEVLDKDGLEALGRLVRVKYEIEAKQRKKEKDNFSGFGRRRWVRVLKTVLAAQGNIDAYVDLCRESGARGRRVPGYSRYVQEE